MGIHGFFYLIIGIVLAAYYQFIDTTGEPFFKIFFYIGVVFIFWGIVKLIFAPSSRRRAILRQQKKSGKSLRFVYCPRCKARNFQQSRFCHICGYRIV
ncbi:MAG: hypothetical protein ABIB43_02455 [archaeon]